MKSLVWRAMADGAVGFSTGLQYVPGTYARAPEIIELARIAANAGGVYASHMRNEGTALEAAVTETIRIGAATGARVQISHLKVDSPSKWGASAKALDLIDAARARGVVVEADQYAYTAASSTLGIRFPAWALEGGRREDRRAPQRPAHLGTHQIGDGGTARRARAVRSLLRRRRIVEIGSGTERAVDETDRPQAQGIGVGRRAVRGGAGDDARGRRVDGLPLHVGRGRRSDHEASARRDCFGQLSADDGRGRAAPARLRQQCPRAGRVRSQSGT